MRIIAKLLAAAALAGGATLGAPTAQAASDPAASVEVFCNSLVEGVRIGKGAGGRVAQIRPLIDKSFELPVVAQFAVGPAWSGMTSAERTSILAGLARYTAARYAKEFDRYNSQRCNVDRPVIERGADRLVKTQITEPGDVTSVNYRLRQYDGAWKIIDVYFDGVSQLALQRSDFAGVLRASGPGGLSLRLNELSAQMLGEKH